MSLSARRKVAIIAGAVVVSLLLGTFIVAGHDLMSAGDDDRSDRASDAPDAPWRIEALPQGGSRVMGLVLQPAGTSSAGSAASGAQASSSGPQASTLADAQARWGDGMRIGIIAAPGEDGALEAYADPANAGGISGKLVLAARLPREQLRAMRERALKSEFMESTTRLYTLTREDLATALKAPIAQLTFIPQASLDEGIVSARFGPAAERIRATDQAEHFLYPDKGLDIALPARGKALLQYIAPGDFHLLREPLTLRPAASSRSQAAARPDAP